jgi:hypothetical protein
LTAVFRAAEPLLPADRSLFLIDVAAALDGQELGDGLVARVCRDVQRRYFDPPDLSHYDGPKVLRKIGGGR